MGSKRSSGRGSKDKKSLKFGKAKNTAIKTQGKVITQDEI